MITAMQQSNDKLLPTIAASASALPYSIAACSMPVCVESQSYKERYSPTALQPYSRSRNCTFTLSSHMPGPRRLAALILRCYFRFGEALVEACKEGNYRTITAP